MDISVLWRATLAQAVCVGAVFALLVVAPLPEGFFRDYGAVAGPLAWLVAALAAGRLARLAPAATLLSAAAGGAAAGVLGMLVGHTVGLVAGVALFGLVSATCRRTAHTHSPRPAPS